MGLVSPWGVEALIFPLSCKVRQSLLFGSMLQLPHLLCPLMKERTINCSVLMPTTIGLKTIETLRLFGHVLMRSPVTTILSSVLGLCATALFYGLSKWNLVIH